jgi:capsular exopolysaccharide synthesis family protein
LGNDVALTPGERQALVDPFAPTRGFGLHWQEGNSRGQSLDLASLVRILNDHRWIIAGAVGLGLALAVLATLMTTPMYRADVTMEVSPPNVEIMDESKTKNAGGSESTWDQVTTQAGLLSSRSLAERVAQDLNLAADQGFVGTAGDAQSRLKIAAARIQGGLNVVIPEEGRLITFSYTTDSAERAARIANGVADSFIDSNLQRRYDASAYARKFLQQQIAKTRGDLERSEREMVAYAQAEGIINTASAPGQEGGDTSSLQGESLVALNRALAEATARRVLAEGAYRQANLAGSVEATQNTTALRQSRATLEAEYQEKRTLMKPDHPDMLSLRSRLDELDRQIAREGSQAAGGRSNALLAEYRAAAAAERSLQGRVSALKGSVLDLRGRSIRYNILQREVDTNRGLYDALLQRYKEIGVAGGVGASPVSIVDRAAVPGGPYKPNLMYNLLAGIALGLLAGVAAALALEFVHDTIKTREDVRTKLDLACLGVVPRSGKSGVVEDLKEPTSSVSEAYSAVLAALRFSTEHGAPKAVLIASSEPAEGKSSTAFALAQNYARRGESVLLIDADLRRPAFRGASNRQGLTKLLTNDDPVRGHVLETQFENLSLLPCGPTPPNPADLLSTGRFSEILAEAAEQFDRIIIDGPPVLGLADTSLLAAAAGSVMMVVESGRTRTRAAREAVDRVQATGAHIIGVTLTKSTEGASQYGYRLYKYGYKQVGQKRNEIVMISHQSEG